MPEFPTFSVSGLNQYIKSVLDRDEFLNGLFVRGEISNYKCYPSGHHYFSLKDAEGAIRCVMFRREASRLRFRPENGMKVVAFGRVTVFPRDGQYQLYCADLIPDGVGDLSAAFEQLKNKLAGEGLFAPERKRPIPAYPKKIALITSPAGAAVRDMLRILKARWPLAGVVLIPASVQGTEAPGEICQAFSLVRYCDGVDLVIAGRGGGSMEDLWCFNDENVARAIAACPVPVISAVGHEPDFTIADFVADLRAATPSNGAELATPDVGELRAWVEGAGQRMRSSLERRLRHDRARLDRLGRSRVLRDPMAAIEDKRLLLDFRRDKLTAALKGRVREERGALGRLAASLDAMSPLKVLARGYAIPRNEDGAVLRSVKDTTIGAALSLRFTDGSAFCRVEGVKEHGGKEKAKL